MKNLPRSLSRHARSKIIFKTKIALNTFGSAMIYFDFERTAETKYQRSQYYSKEKPRDFERPHQCKLLPSQTAISIL